MRVRAYRITQKRYASTAFDGEGAKQYGGRWNSPGTPMIYTSDSISLATLELLVHIGDLATLRNLYCVIPIEFESRDVETAEPKSLPEEWNAPQPIAATQLFGDAWANSGTSAILAVPSAVTPTESNYLLNPLHKDFDSIVILEPLAFTPDSRR